MSDEPKVRSASYLWRRAITARADRIEALDGSKGGAQ